MTDTVINLVKLQKKVQSIELLLHSVRNQLPHMSYDVLCDLERQVQEFLKTPEDDTPSLVFPLTGLDLPGATPTPHQTVHILVPNWRDEIPYIVYRAVAVQRGDTGNIDKWMLELMSDKEQEARLLNSTFGDLFLDDSDIEEIIDAVLTHIRKHTSTAHYTFFFDTKFHEAMLETQNTVEFLIKSIQEEVAKTTFP